MNIDTLILALALILVIEGLAWSILPKKFLEKIAHSLLSSSEMSLKAAGLTIAIIGIVIIWVLTSGG